MENFEKFQKKIGKYSRRLDDSILGDFQKQVLSKFLEPLNSDVPRSALNLALNYKIAQAVTINRPYIVYENMPVLINFYGLLFMPSGSGKDRMLNHLNRGLMQKVENYHMSRVDNFVISEEKRIRKLAEEKFEHSKAGAEKYVSDNSPRYILFEGSDGTLEGWYAQREVLKQAGFGATNFSHSEFGDIIGRQSEANKMLLMYLKESYDGETKAKVIKGNKTVKPVKNVPGNLFAHSPLKSILKDDNKEALIDFLDSGLARRTLLCIETQDYQRGADQQALDRKTARAEARAQTADAWGSIGEYADNLARIVAKGKVKVGISDNATDALEYYREYCQWRARELDNVHDEGKVAELKGRFFKALKLAGLIHIVDDLDGDISVLTITKAIAQVEFYSKYIDSVYAAVAPDPAIKIYNVLLKNLWRVDGMTRTELINESGVNKDAFYKNDKAIMAFIEDMADQDGYRCVHGRGDNNSIRVSLVNNPARDLDDETIQEFNEQFFGDTN